MEREPGTVKTLVLFQGTPAERALLLEMEGQEFQTVEVDFADRGERGGGGGAGAGAGAGGAGQLEPIAKELGATAHHRLDVRREVYEQAILPLIHAGAFHRGDPLWTLAADAATGAALGRFAEELECERLVGLVPPVRARRYARVLAGTGSELRVELRGSEEAPGQAGVLWGRRIEAEELFDPESGEPFWGEPELEELYGDDPLPGDAELAEELELEFKKGAPVASMGTLDKGPALVRLLGKTARRHALGQGLVVCEDDEGVRRRWAVSAPAATLIRVAHRALEEATLTPEQLELKDSLVPRYLAGVAAGRWGAPDLRDLEALLKSCQERVCGDVRLRLCQGTVQSLGVRW